MATVLQMPVQPAAQNPILAAVTAPVDNTQVAAPVDAPDASVLCRWFEEAEQMTMDARRLSERDRDYYDGSQWTERELAILRKRGQPALTINYVKRKVEYLRGFERRMRSDPKAFPRNPDDDQLSEAATDALRYVADRNEFDVTRSDVYEDMLVEGSGAGDVTVEQGHDGVEVLITRVPWDRTFADPYSRKKDFSDAKYKGIVVWMDKDEALETFPDYTEAIEGTLASTSLSDTYDDRPKFSTWSDNRRTRVRIIQIQFKWKGTWMIATVTKGGYLTEPVVSPYMDREDKPACSLIMRSAYVDRENNRYGWVRDVISIQDEINKRRSKALHLMNVRQTFGNRQAIADVDRAKREMAKPDGHIEVEANGKFGEDFGILPTGDMASAQMELLQHATGEMQSSGPNAAMAGKDPRTQSGRAITAQQAGGQIEVEPIIDDLKQWTKQVYEAAWLRVRQFWTEEKWIRVTDDEKNAKWVGLNQPVTLADALSQLPPDQAAQYAQQMQLQPNDPRLDQIVRMDNDIAGLDVDITLDEGPDVANSQAEQFQQLAQLAQSGIPFPPEVIIQASSLRNKDKLIEMLDQAKQQAAQQQAQAQQVAQQSQAVKDQDVQAAAQLKGAQAEHALALARKESMPEQPEQQAQPQEQSTPYQQYLDSLEQSAKIDHIKAQTGQAQAAAIKSISDSQRAPAPSEYE